MPSYNWTPVVLDLLYLLTEEGGAKLVAVDDGGNEFIPIEATDPLEARIEAAAAITSVDESWLQISLDGVNAAMFIVLGNEPHETVNDYSVKSGTTLSWMLEAILHKFERLWEGKPCPMIDETIAYERAAYRLHTSGSDILSLDSNSSSRAIDDCGALGAWVPALIWIKREELTAEDRA